MPRNVIAGSSSRSIPNFLSNHYIDFNSDCTYLHSNQQECSPYPTSSISGVTIYDFDLSQSDRQNLESQNSFDFSFPLQLRMLTISQPFEILLVRILSLNLYPIFNFIIWFVDVQFLGFIIFCRYLLSVKGGVSEHIYSFCRLPFSPIDSVFYTLKNFYKFMK